MSLSLRELMRARMAARGVFGFLSARGGLDSFLVTVERISEEEVDGDGRISYAGGSNDPTKVASDPSSV